MNSKLKYLNILDLNFVLKQKKQSSYNLLFASYSEFFRILLSVMNVSQINYAE